MKSKKARTRGVLRKSGWTSVWLDGASIVAQLTA
jgi:hypothetical protein